MSLLTGSCMCGDVSYAAEAEPALSCLCHCVDCQKWSGGAFTSNVVVPRESVKVTKGKPAHYDAIGNSGKVNRHYFCSRCGSSLFTELEIMADKTVLKAGTLDQGAAALRGAVDIEFYIKDRVPYLAAVDGAKQEPAFGG